MTLLEAVARTIYDELVAWSLHTNAGSSRPEISTFISTAVLALPQLRGLAEGTHVVVPKEPTDAMLRAGSDLRFTGAPAYRAMLAAAEKG